MTETTPTNSFEPELGSDLPRYDLSIEELAQLESELAKRAKDQFPEEGLTSVWIQPNSKYANFVRTHEAGFFPEVQQLSEVDESNTLFYVIVDTRDSADRVVHAATITGKNTTVSYTHLTLPTILRV